MCSEELAKFAGLYRHCCCGGAAVKVLESSRNVSLSAGGARVRVRGYA